MKTTDDSSVATVRQGDAAMPEMNVSPFMEKG
jgi:hypothetical protein